MDYRMDQVCGTRSIVFGFSLRADKDSRELLSRTRGLKKVGEGVG